MRHVRFRLRYALTAALLAVFAASLMPFASATPGGFVAQAATPTTYYVDCAVSNDNGVGTTPATAWKTLSRANKAKLQPGDQLLLKRGCAFAGPLVASWAGTAAAPITISAYGNGALPVIQNAKQANLEVRGSYQVIEYLATNHAPGSYDRVDNACYQQAYGWRLGAQFVGAHHNVLRNSRLSGASIGIFIKETSYNNRIMNNQIVNNTGLWDNLDSTGVLLNGNANEIGYNHFEGNQSRCKPNKSIAIELFNATGSNVHHNTVYGDRVFAELGSGAIISRDNTFAYNVHATDFSPVSGNGARFIVTHGANVKFGPVWNTHLLNNTVYYTGTDSQGVVCQGACTGESVSLKNSIIVARTKVIYVGAGHSIAESHNLYWHPDGSPPKNNFIQNLTMANTSKLESPKFVNPGARDFHLQSDSPAINGGTLATVNAGYLTDLDGDLVPTGASPEIGVDENAEAAPIAANVPPTARFTVACTDLNCSFDGNGSSDPEGPIAEYRWDFGNGKTATGATASHAFVAAGEKTVTLTVVDAAGATASVQQKVTVTDPAVVAKPAPMTIQAEDYRAGGQGVTYNDTTPGNNGGLYRNDDVDLQATSDVGGGFHLGWLDRGEWLDYDLSVVQSGQYTISLRVASLNGDKRLRLQVDGVDVAVITVPATGGWQSWANVTTDPIALPAGNLTFTLVSDTEGVNINYFTFAPAQ